MYNFKRSLISLAGLLVLIGITAAITPFKGYSQNGPQAVTAVQDVRVVNAPNSPVPTKIINSTTAPVPVRDNDAPRANNMVTLYASNQTGYDFRRVLSNGTRANSEFVVPPNRVLIVTDVIWDLNQPNNSTGTTIHLGVRGAGGAAHVVHVSHLTGDGSGGISSTESLKTGFAAAAGATIGMSIAGLGPSNVILHGYLVPAN